MLDVILAHPPSVSKVKFNRLKLAPSIGNLWEELLKTCMFAVFQ